MPSLTLPDMWSSDVVGDVAGVLVVGAVDGRSRSGKRMVGGVAVGQNSLS
jgi:hypothetical protein